MFKVAFRIVYRIKGRCSRHPAYNPVKDEQGGIKGECEECHALFRAYRAYLAFREAIEEFETTVQLFKSGNGPRASASQLSFPSTRRRKRGIGNSIAPEVLSESRK
jgi:hypothetical protein